MKNIIKRNEDKLVRIMCMAPGMFPLYSKNVEHMSDENVPRITSVTMEHNA